MLVTFLGKPESDRLNLWMSSTRVKPGVEVMDDSILDLEDKYMTPIITPMHSHSCQEGGGRSERRLHQQLHRHRRGQQHQLLGIY